jgi:hypothetical protein
MLAAFPWVGFVLGLALVVATWRSIVTTVILPRLVASPITAATWRAVHAIFRFVANRRRRYASKDRLLALLGPVAVLATLVSWIVLLLLGYGLMLWPLTGESLGAALRLAGSSLFTLGFVSSTKSGASVLEFIAAASGLVVVALQIGYLPVLYGAYNRRETLLTALSARSGEPSWGPEILARHQLDNAVSILPAFFAAWETWAADITESHSSYPWLMVFRSPAPLQSWVVSLLGMLDAAAIYLAVAPSKAPPEARQFLRAGFVGLRTLSRVTGTPVSEDPLPDDPIDLTFDQFANGVALIREAGFPVERTAEESWRDFHGWRVNYEAAAYVLAEFVVAVPAPWSGQRTNMTREAVFDALANRPRHRTPDDPEGRAAIPSEHVRADE